MDSGPLDPHNIADRWVRALEEETGAVCISRAGVAAVGTSSDAGPSNLTSRAGMSADDGVVFKEVRKLLPDFTLGSYEQFLKIFQRREDCTRDIGQ